MWREKDKKDRDLARSVPTLLSKIKKGGIHNRISNTCEDDFEKFWLLVGKPRTQSARWV